VTDARRSTLLWLGVIGPPLAWTLELVLAYGVEDAVCAPGSMRWGIDGQAWQAAVLIVAGLLALVGTLAALVSWRAVRAGMGDPRGRVHFLAVTSLSAALLFLVLTVMTGVGVLSLESCRG
jgi:hypothetical protein